MSVIAGIERPRSGRIVAGVCAGVGRASGIDPMALRVLTVGLTVVGAGIPLYLIAWLVLSSDDRVGKGLRPERPIRALLVLIILGALGAGATFVVLELIRSLIGFGISDEIGLALFLILLGLGALWWREMARLQAAGPPAFPSVAPAARPSSPAAVVEKTTPTPAVHGRSGLVFAPIVLLIALLVGALPLLSADLDGGAFTWDKGVAAAVVVLGVGLIVGAFLRRGAWLIPFGAVASLALVVLTIAGADFRGGAGERVVAPTTAAALPEEFRLAAGDAVLDLRRLDLRDAERNLDARVSAGRLVVRLPRDARTVVRGHVGFGEINITPGERPGTITVEGFDAGSASRAASGAEKVEGVDVEASVTVPGSNGTLVIDAEVGFGELEVTW